MAGRGRPARITRDQIVQAAREAGDDLRMTDVARALDVAPAALYHHVRDREELMQLVAAQVLEETAFDDWAPRSNAKWETWLRRYAESFRAAMLENAGMLKYVRLTTASTAGRLDVFDRFVGVLRTAGFSYADISKALAQVNLLVVGEAWERVVGDAEGGQETQLTEFDSAVGARPDTELPHLRPLADASMRPDADAQFAFAIDCLVAGMQAKLS